MVRATFLKAALVTALSPSSLVSARETARFATATEALRALARASGKIVCWVGTPPSGPVALSDRAQTLSDAAREWAHRWGAAAVATPDAIFFHTPDAFAKIRPAHNDPLLPVYHILAPLQRLPDPVLARFPMESSHSSAEDAPPDLQGAIALTEVERAAPGFEAALRKLLEAADAHAQAPIRQGEEQPLGAALYTAPAQQLYLRFDIETSAFLRPNSNDFSNAASMALPTSTPDALPDTSLTRPAGLLAQATSADIRVFAGPLGELISGGKLTADNRAGAPVFVDRRLAGLPVTVCLPSEAVEGKLWPTLEAGLGVERRDLGDVLFFGPWLDANSHPQFCFLSRWIGVHGQLWSSLFMPHLFRRQMIKSADLTPAQRRLLQAHRNRLQPSQPNKKLSNEVQEQLLSSGLLSLSQGQTLEILYTAPGTSGNKPAVLGSYYFFLQ